MHIICIFLRTSVGIGCFCHNYVGILVNFVAQILAFIASSVSLQQFLHVSTQSSVKIIWSG
jgi:hypothetical protein